MSWAAPGVQNFVAIGSEVSVPQIRDFAVLLGWLVCSFFGFFNKATAYTPGRIFTHNTSNDVVPGKEVTTLKKQQKLNVINYMHETNALAYTFKAGSWQI